MLLGWMLEREVCVWATGLGVNGWTNVSFKATHGCLFCCLFALELVVLMLQCPFGRFSL